MFIRTLMRIAVRFPSSHQDLFTLQIELEMFKSRGPTLAPTLGTGPDDEWTAAEIRSLAFLAATRTRDAEATEKALDF